MKLLLLTLLFVICAVDISAQKPKSLQMPPIGPGVSRDLAIWRAAHYSDIRYKLNLTFEKMSPVLKGTIELRIKYAAVVKAEPNAIILDWRKIVGHEKDSTVSNISVNGIRVNLRQCCAGTIFSSDPSVSNGMYAYEYNEHLIFRDGVLVGENDIKLDFTSPILTSGSAVVRSVDKKDGSERIVALFGPEDASTAFPVFDQPDLRARFTFNVLAPVGWTIVSNSAGSVTDNLVEDWKETGKTKEQVSLELSQYKETKFPETKPISIYAFHFKAGPKP